LFFSPNGNALAIVRGQELEVVEAATGKQTRSIAVGSRIVSVAFSPDGSLLIVATADSKVRAYGKDGKLIWERGQW